MLITATKQLEQLEHSCHLQLLKWSDTVVPCRAKDHPLHPRRSYFAPIKNPQNIVFLAAYCIVGLSILSFVHFWWRRRVPPPGPNGLLRCQFIAIAKHVRILNIVILGGKKKVLSVI